MTHWLILPLLGTVVCLDYAADLASYREKCKSKPSTAFCWMDDASNVDASCRFAARAGLVSMGASSVGPLLDLRFDDDTKAWAAVPHALTGTKAHAFSSKPRLCALATDQTDPSPSLLLIANSVDYVFRLWPYFINKVLWASTTKHRLSIWIGELPKIVAAKSGDGCRASKQKQSLYSRRLKQSYYASQPQKSSNHHAKMLAAYRLLASPHVTGLYYVDMDAYVRPDALFAAVPALFRKAHYDDAVDVLFENARDPGLFWHLHGDTFYLRDVALSRIFLKEWLERRCGFKDQYSLWHAVLGLAGAAGCMRYDGEIYKNFTYQEALHIDKNAWKSLKMTCGGRQKRCPAFRFCRDKYDLARQHFIHSNIDAGATRRFRYDVGGGWRADVVVADLIGGAEGDDDAVDKSDLLGALGLMNVGADRVLGQLPPLETPPSSGVSVGWLLFLVPGVLVAAWRCRSRQEPEDEAFSAYGTRRPALRKFT